jgi:hypothetical protein
MRVCVFGWAPVISPVCPADFASVLAEFARLRVGAVPKWDIDRKNLLGAAC